MTSLSTLRDKSRSICGEEEGECMKDFEDEERGERGKGGKGWHGMILFSHRWSGIRWPLRAGIGIDTDDGRIPV